MIKKFDLFFRNYLRERKEIFIEYIIYILIKKNYFIWKFKKMMSLLFLNISKIFDNVFY